MSRFGPKPKPAAERFWTKVEKSDTCWLWLGVRHRGGYGRFRGADQELVYAHRWSYEHAIGPIPSGLTLDHLCRVTSCVRPSHMEPVTLAENLARSHRDAPRRRKAA
jgi:hypothetical protein